MSQSQARADIMAVVDQIRQDFPDYALQVETDNRTLADQADQAGPYLKVEIDFLDGAQLDLADRPLVRQYGQLVIYAVDKEGNGSDAALRLLDFARPYFSLKRCGIVNFHAMVGTKAKKVNGLFHAPALADFWYDELS